MTSSVSALHAARHAATCGPPSLFEILVTQQNASGQSAASSQRIAVPSHGRSSDVQLSLQQYSLGHTRFRIGRKRSCPAAVGGASAAVSEASVAAGGTTVAAGGTTVAASGTTVAASGPVRRSRRWPK